MTQPGTAEDVAVADLIPAGGAAPVGGAAPGGGAIAFDVSADGAIRRPGSDATLERLREMILTGELPPGSVVSQLTLARSLGISTTPLREVIRQLQVEGLLEIQLNRRPRVAPLDLEDLHGVYAGRILLESLSISLTVPQMTLADLAALQGDLAEMRELAPTGDAAKWSAVHTRFHRRLVTAVPVAIAGSMTNLFDRSERYRRLMSMPGLPRNWEDADRDHQKITEACIAGDGTAAANELAKHLARTALSLSAAFAPDMDPQAVRLAVRMVTGPNDGVALPARKVRRPN